MRWILFAVVCAAFAADGDKGHAGPAKMLDASADRFELLTYQERDINTALEAKRAQLRDQYTKICKEAGIEATDFQILITTCEVDFVKRIVAHKKPPTITGKVTPASK